MAKRLMCIMISVLMVVSILPAGAVATEETGETEEAITYEEWTATDSLPTSGTYKLTTNVSLSASVTVESGRELIIDLNGYQISDSRTVFDVNGTLILNDSSTEKSGTVTCTSSTAAAIKVENDAEFTLNGGKIEGKKNGIQLFTNSEFVMNGGTITTNNAGYGISVGSTTTSQGGAKITIKGGTITENNTAIVVLSAGEKASTITMSGGSITSNSSKTVYSSTYVGIIVLFNSSFTMSGGSITDNKLVLTADYTGNSGAVCVATDSTFTMTGGEISGTAPSTNTNYKMYGGGVYVCSTGTFNMNGGTISGNTAYYGGGVYNLGTFNMSDGSISNNSATMYNGSTSSDLQYGGGVYGTINMTGGNITGNLAKYGAGVYVTGDSSMTGGTIANNTATSNTNVTGGYGGGVYISSGTLTVGGGVITGNTADAYGGGVYSTGSGALTLTSGAIYGNTATIGETYHYSGSDIYNNSGTVSLIAANQMSATDVDFTGYAWFSDFKDNRYGSEGYTGGIVSVDSLSGEVALIAAVDENASEDQGSGGEEETVTYEEWLGTYAEIEEYTISSVQEWLYFVKAVNTNGYDFSGKTVKLTADLDFVENPSVEPVGTTTTNFKGTFDGQNYTISHISYDSTYTATYAGVFGVTSGATIQNLKVDGCSFSVSTGGYAGAIAASAENGTKIINCTSTNNTISAWFAGGIVGHTFSATLTNVTSTNTVFSSNSKSGCVVGYAEELTIDGAEVNSTLTQSGSLPGAVIGQANGTSTLSNLTVDAGGLYVIGSMETNNEYTVTITGDENSVTAAAIAGNVLTNTTLVITGGNYTVDEIVSGEDTETSTVTGTVSISGGTYSTTLDDSYIAMGYEAVDNNNETYTVRAVSSWVIATNVRNGYDIAMGFYVPMSQLTTSHTVTITFNDATYDSSTSSWTTTKKVHTIDSENWITSTLTYNGEEVECYVIVFEGIWAMQMDEKITLDIYDSSSAVCESFTTTINEYEDAYITSDTYKDNTDAVSLANAVKAYGAAAKTFYSYSTSSESDS